MTQDEINGMLAAALDDAQKRIDVQEKCIEMLVDQIEDMAHQMTGVLEEARVARLCAARIDFQSIRSLLATTNFGRSPQCGNCWKLVENTEIASLTGWPM